MRERETERASERERERERGEREEVQKIRETSGTLPPTGFAVRVARLRSR